MTEAPPGDGEEGDPLLVRGAQSVGGGEPSHVRRET